MKTFPKLYKKTNTGAIQYWKISVAEKFNSGNGTCWLITTEYGQKDTDKPQLTSDTIYSGKNIGKKNATTTKEQAFLEAKYKWEKQKKKGYCETESEASAGKVDKIIEGGILPMLAHTYEKQGDKIIFPCYVQPKLDGHRCIAIVKNGKCTLWTRTRKKITSVPHIISELEEKIKDWKTQSFILDGELYNHDFKNDFEHISHLVRQEEPDPNHKDVQYHVYDLVEPVIFSSRYTCLVEFTKGLDQINITESIKLVQTEYIKQQEEIKKYFKQFLNKGYEGIMLRNVNGPYENKRSVHLQKVKEFEDAEFPIVGFKEGKGKLRGHIGAFTCELDSGETFDVKMSGETERLKDFFKDHSLWKGKKLTVQFQGYSKYNIPRFPVGLRFKEDL